jgi:DnaJ-class molecular chaperone
MNPYSVLQVPVSASQDEIRDAYRKLAKKCHPDLNPGNKEVEKKFKDLNAAKEILTNPEKRAKFDNGEIDEWGTPKYQQPSQEEESASKRGPFYYETQNGGGRYSSAFEGVGADFFEEILGRRNAQNQVPQSQDEHYKMEVSFNDAALGAKREITLPSGKIIKINIPAGIDSGKKLRFKGAVNSQKELSGDIYIEIRVHPSKLFTRHDNNDEMELPISLNEAILGAEIEAPTLENPVKLKIPPGSNSGTKLRMRGKGIGGKTRGDIIITLKVVLPTIVDPELQRLVKEWSSTHSYNPRDALDPKEN